MTDAAAAMPAAAAVLALAPDDTAAAAAIPATAEPALLEPDEAAADAAAVAIVAAAKPTVPHIWLPVSNKRAST